MSESKVGICNSALIKIGADRINSLDDQSREARLCDEQYDRLRRVVLESHPWNFALRRKTLAEDTTEPVWGWDHAYPVPGDCLRPLQIKEDFEWTFQNKKILTDADDCNLEYIRDEQDTDKFTGHFVEALALKMAAELAYPISGNVSLGKRLEEKFLQHIAEARSYDGQEQRDDNLWDDTWIDARL